MQAFLYAGTKAIDHPGVVESRGLMICGQRMNLWVLFCLKWTELHTTYSSCCPFTWYLSVDVHGLGAWNLSFSEAAGLQDYEARS